MALLQDDFWLAMFHDGTGCESTVDDAPSRSTHIASCFLELEKLSQELKSKLHDDFMNILNGVGDISLSSGPQQAPSPAPSPPSRSLSPIHSTSFISEAYAWLLDNIANPYPSSTVKASLTQRHNCSLSAVNSWFINARRRIGWTTLCRDRFNNCRADALDAAHRALVKEDSNRQLPPDIVHAFIGVKVAAEDLYSSTLTKSALANHLEAVVHGMSVQDGVSANEQKCREHKGTTEFSKASGADSARQILVARNWYPSPDPSPSSSPVTARDESLSDKSEGGEETLPLVLAGRSLSRSEAAHRPASEPTTRLVKHPRHSSSPVKACLPSPATNAREFPKNDQAPQSAPTTRILTDPKTRKRRLSDADTVRSPKRLRGYVATPQPHAVSNPLPLPVPGSDIPVDEWFKTNFDVLFALPAPVDVVEPDLATKWEVELFNNYIVQNPQSILTPPIQDNQTSATFSDLTALDDCLQSFESGISVAPPETIQPPTMGSIPHSTPQDLPLLPDLPQAIDWTALLNEDPSELASNPILPQSYIDSALPEIDLSILQLPHTRLR